MSYRTIEQKISAAGDFDGTAPTGDREFANNMESYPEQAAGGLFDFGQDGPIEVRQVFVTLGGQSAWSLSLVDADATETELDAGTVETFYAKLDWRFVMLKGQMLKLATTGASTAMKARVTINPRA